MIGRSFSNGLALAIEECDARADDRGVGRIVHRTGNGPKHERAIRLSEDIRGQK